MSTAVPDQGNPTGGPRRPRRPQAMALALVLVLALAAAVLLGYRLAGHRLDKARAYGVVVNPNKADGVTFGPDDMIIVIAEE